MKYFCLFLVVIISGCSVDTKHKKNNEIEDTKVYVKGNKVYYDGMLTLDANELVKKLIKENKIDTLVIKSRGGVVSFGIDLGNIVFDNKLNIQVNDYCNSSCANYVFPAGKIKYIQRDSQLAWHGGATQSLTVNYDDEFFNILKNDTKKREDYIRISRRDINREKLFFKKIGVDQLITVFGQTFSAQLDMIEKEHQLCVWSYSVDAMKQFGINNIVLMDGEWMHPILSKNGVCIYQFNNIIMPL